MIQKDDAKPVRKAIPFSSQKLEKIVIERCFLKTLHFKQLNTLLSNCLYLKELDLTNIFKSIQKDVPLDLVDCLQVITNSSCGQTLESLGLSNNFFGDHTLEVITQRILPNLKLQYIDLSANKLTDSGLFIFFNVFVSKNTHLKGFKINYNKITQIETAKIITEATMSCHSLERMSFRKCGLSWTLFQEMLTPSNGNGFIRSQHRYVDLCMNKISNEGLTLLKRYIAGTMFGKSQLKHLSLYDNELAGDVALGDIKELFIVLKNLEFVNLDGNLFSKIDMMAM